MNTTQEPSPHPRASNLPKIVLSGAIFFMLLYGYFLLRPLREAMGVERSMRDLRWLFVTTCIVSLIITLAFGSLVSRANPRRFMTIGYRVVIACLIVFVISIKALPQEYKLYSGYVFYVWLSVVNLFMVSVFWGFMADSWSLEDAKKLYPSIGVGGTLGALLGSFTVWQFGEIFRSLHRGVIFVLSFTFGESSWIDRFNAWLHGIYDWFSSNSNGAVFQMLAACVCFDLAVQIMRRVKPAAHQTQEHHYQPIGGSWHEGAKALLRSPYLLGIGLYITLIAISSTLIYFTQANIVADAEEELTQRVALFAQLDMWTQLATLLVQLFVTAQLIKRLGIGITLCILPFVTLAGFTALGWISSRPNVEGWQIFAVFATFNAIHRASRYAIIRPARETLFSVVSRQEKYKAKPIIDVFLYRGGDVAGAGIENALAAATIGIWGMVMVTAPLAVLWSGLAISLALMQHRRSSPVSQIAHTKVQPQEITT